MNKILITHGTVLTLGKDNRVLKDGAVLICGDKIAAIVVESGNETPGFGTRCAEDEAFLAQFIGKQLPLESIDVLSGATVTSNAVMAALNAAK